MTKLTRPSGLFLISLVLILTIFPACDEDFIDIKKLDAEEAGYYKEFKDIVDEMVKLPELYIFSKQLEGYKEIEFEEKVNKTQVDIDNILNKLKNVYQTNAQKLENTLPPRKFKFFHMKLKLFLKLLHKQGDWEVIKNECRDVILFSKYLKREVDSRDENDKIASGSFCITYSPVSLFGIVTGDKGFNVSLGFTTPIGVIGFTKKEFSGVKRLIIISDGLKRYFSLDRPFKIFIPTDYGVEVEGDTIDLYIRVVKKKS